MDDLYREIILPSFKITFYKIRQMELCYMDKCGTQHFVKQYPSRSAAFIQNSNIVASLWMFSWNESAEY